MNNTVSVRNRQKSRKINPGYLREIARMLLTDLLEVVSFELSIGVVGAPEMARLNEKYLRHAGSTDVLAFDYGSDAKKGMVSGEIFVCVDEALIQARRFRTTWQAEVVRYLVHGILHLLGHSDHNSTRRRTMKREENRLLRELARRMELPRLSRERIGSKCLKKAEPGIRQVDPVKGSGGLEQGTASP